MARLHTLIGFGEAGRTLARAAGWSAGAQVFDIKTDDDATRTAMLAAYADAAVTGCPTLRDALAGAGVALSLVTADQALCAASNAAQHIAPGTVYFDMNSVAPGTKVEAARLIESACGRYVDVAVMAPVNPACMSVPLLVSGPHAADGAAILSRLGFDKVRVVAGGVGRASSIKMIRSVMVKGLEALTAECVLAADAAGVTDEVLGSLGDEWRAKADYNLDRMMVHGVRRAAEMDEVVITLEALGIEPLMTRGTVRRQRAIGNLGVSVPPDALDGKLERLKQA